MKVEAGRRTEMIEGWQKISMLREPFQWIDLRDGRQSKFKGGGGGRSM